MSISGNNRMATAQKHMEDQQRDHGTDTQLIEKQIDLISDVTPEVVQLIEQAKYCVDVQIPCYIADQALAGVVMALAEAGQNSVKCKVLVMGTSGANPEVARASEMLQNCDVSVAFSSDLDYDIVVIADKLQAVSVKLPKPVSSWVAPPAG